MPAFVAPASAWPLAFSPIRFPSTTLSFALTTDSTPSIRIWTPPMGPLPSLPAMTFPAPEAVPPIVLPVALNPIPSAVANRHRPGHVGADKVARDEVARPAPAISTPAFVLPEMMLRAAAGAADRVVGGAITQLDAVDAVAQRGGAGCIRADELPSTTLPDEMEPVIKTPAGRRFPR